MLPTFIIGLREGLEAALIVGIIAAFLGQQGRTDALRQMWIGVIAAIVLCLAIGVGLDALSRELPQKQQEMLETIIGLIAVGFVTYMILWMRNHARDLKGEIEGHAASALADGSARALVFMAFLAVMREGFETAVFLLATFQNSTNKAAGGFGALLGVLTSAVIGYLIFRGGLRLNLQRFFRVTGVVLVVIAAGLLMGAFRTGHEAGWVTFGQGETIDLAWLIRPGTPIESVFTGVLGIRQKPAPIELIAYFAYLIPMLYLVLSGPRSRGRTEPLNPSRPDGDVQGDTLNHLTPTQPASARRLLAGLLLLPGIGLLATSCAKSDDTVSKDAISVEITDAGCQPTPSSTPSGQVTFEITNKGSAKATEAELKSPDGKSILGEKENLTDGLSGNFTLNLAEGTYKMYCPGAKQDTWDFKVTKGDTVKDWKDNPLLVTAVKGYSDYVDEQAALLATETKKFTDAVRAGDVDKAKDLYGPARVPYERIEPVAESFGDLDPKIDGRADDGVEPEDLTGFHRLEYALWVQKSLTGMGPIADQLDADIKDLQDLVAEKSGSYVPEEVTNGAMELMNEVMTGKMPGEEERYSHTDLIDFQANLDGSMKSIDLVRPVLEKSAPDLLKKIDAAAKKVQTALDGYKEDPGYAGTGFKEWGYVDDKDSVVTDAQRRALSDVVKPLTELLSQVPVKVVV